MPPPSVRDKLFEITFLENVMDTQRREGIAQEKERTAFGLFKEEINIQIISRVTGLSEDELLNLFRKVGLI